LAERQEKDHMIEKEGGTWGLFGLEIGDWEAFHNKTWGR